MTRTGRPPLVHPSPALLGAGAVLAQIFYPLVYGGERDALTVLAVVLFAAASTTHAWLTRGRSTALGLLVVFGGGGLLVEALGVASGFPFGRYEYLPSGLGPGLLGVPLVIPLAWVMMAWPSWVVAEHLTREGPWRVVVAAWALASWDLFLDPQMVAEGYWRFTDPGPGLPGVFGVPLTNHLGWLGVSLLLMAAFSRLRRPAPPRRLDAVPVGLYLWVYISSLLAHVVFFGLLWAALWGVLGMGLVALPLLRGGFPPR